MNRYLIDHQVNKEEGPTHTSMMGGLYKIKPSERDKFWSVYFTHTITKANDSFLTEKHPEKFSKVFVDIDLRHDSERYDSRQYDDDFLTRVLQTYYAGFQELFGNTLQQKESYAYVLEKEHPDLDEKRNVLKDGIHIMFPFICIKYSAQHWLRKFVVDKMSEDPILATSTSSIQSIIDEAVVERNNIIMFGSKKSPSSQTYKLTRIFDMNMEEMELPEINVQLLKVLSLQNNFPEKETLIDSIIEKENEKKKKGLDYILGEQKPSEVEVLIEELVSKKSPEYLKALLSLLKPARVEEYSDWFRVGAILHNIDGNLITLWKEWSSQSSKYDEAHCERLWHKYATYPKENQAKIGSLRRMAWHDTPDKYFSIVEKYAGEDDLTNYIRRSFRNTHTDYAELAHHILSEKYKYSKGVWYRYTNRWQVLDEPVPLLKDITIHVKGALLRYSAMLSTKIADTEQQSGDMIPESDPTKVMKMACEKSIHTLSSATYKNSVMNECKEVFYDENFHKELDMDNHLLGFNNGVYDLKSGLFRDQKPEDKISYSAGYDYSPDVISSIRDEIMDLFQKSLPSADVCEFALLFLSSTLIGTNKNELFVNFEGTGGNGKGVITTLHDNSLGDYAGILDNSYITNISNSQEGHNSKLISIFKKRYVQVNEPPNEKKLNIDFIKEITGGDKIQIRKAHSPNPELTDIPKFTLVMLCNKMPKIDDVHDGGFIRRYVGINFPNRFVMHEPKKANEFRADPNLKPKLKDNIQYRQQYMLILLDYVKMYIANKQKLVIPSLVSMNSSRMLKNQDSYSEFLEEQIEITENVSDGIIIRDLFSMFKDYYQEHISGGKRSPITQTEFIEKMKTCFANYEVEFKNNIKIGGLSRGKGFTGIRIRDEVDDSEE